MNTNIKLVIAATSSFIAGYLFANWQNEKFYFDRANEEVENVREEYEEKLNKTRQKYIESETRQASAALTADEQASTILAEGAAKKEYQETVRAYQGAEPPVLQHEPKHAPRVQYSDYATPEEPTMLPVDKPNVKIITDDEYLDNPDEYDQHTLEYYIGDDVLFDELAGEMIVEVDRRNIITGDRADLLTREGFWSGTTVYYLRNHDLKQDFEIIGYPGKFTDDHESPGGGG